MCIFLESCLVEKVFFVGIVDAKSMTKVYCCLWFCILLWFFEYTFIFWKSSFWEHRGDIIGGPPPRKNEISCFALDFCVPPNFDVADSIMKVPGTYFGIENIYVFGGYPHFCLAQQTHTYLPWFTVHMYLPRYLLKTALMLPPHSLSSTFFHWDIYWG